MGEWAGGRRSLWNFVICCLATLDRPSQGLLATQGKGILHHAESLISGREQTIHAMSHLLYLTPQILLPFSPLTPQEFELIRRRAGESWQKETRWSAASRTTYAGSFPRKELDEPAGGLFSPEAGQHGPECHQISLPNGFTYTPTLSRAGLQDTAGVRVEDHSPRKDKEWFVFAFQPFVLCSRNSDIGLFPHLTGSFKKPLDVKHRVAHQILWGDFSPAPPSYEKSCVRTRKPAFENLTKYHRRKTVSLRLPLEPRSSASKTGSSEDSDADQYYVYSLGGPF